MPRVELLFFPGCPHVALARAALQEALGEQGTWHEIDVTAADAPESVRRFGSPTVLVDGSDVEPGPALSGRACRVYADGTGAPSVAVLRRALGSGAR
jgi:hypothetical protein